ncbi:HAD family hydrolase [Tropicimonas isoalkanivorans]|uniref:Putative hydrolase of the HAD superfamily n=1 Tax=Tropicimonas isoalkanivorans TaxID=441112 RepID=A0A1I1NFX7_9RHOB|nr:HAD family hydrolase [Tropicimonas isoalkanivorans]SFC93683.1 putative hydrolase of the HAD superfamily [Tropicimonas isoalkanivorans]
MKVTTIGFDADDTLWHNERFFVLTQDRFADLLSDYTDREMLDQRLLESEKRNIGHYGYGIKGFMLSMIETAIDVTDSRVPASVIRQILEIGQDMLRHPIELLPHARDAVEAMARSNRKVLLITKGDLLDQERKLTESGLWECFDRVEIVSEKSAEVFDRIFSEHGDGPDKALMVGNSMKSDVLPAIAAGAWGVHVPFHLAWALEAADAPDGHARFRVLEHLGELPNLVEGLG